MTLRPPKNARVVGSGRERTALLPYRGLCYKGQQWRALIWSESISAVLLR